MIFVHVFINIIFIKDINLFIMSRSEVQLASQPEPNINMGLGQKGLIVFGLFFKTRPIQDRLRSIFKSSI
jgi:hypothetical protein